MTILTTPLEPKEIKAHTGGLSEPPRVESFNNGIERVYHFGSNSFTEIFNTEHYKKVQKERME